MSKHKYPYIVVPMEADNPSVVRHKDKCIACGNCQEVCFARASVSGYYDLDKTCDKAICTHCGQCSNVCLTGAIQERSSLQDVKSALLDGKILTISLSPAVRVSLGEMFGMPDGSEVEGKVVTLLKRLGFTYVFDTTFSADMTIMEEANELAHRLNQDENKPMFSSCCPSWVKFVETFYPEFIPNLSTTKSPIAIQGAVINNYFAKTMGIDKSRLVNVALTPCTAKKYEITLPNHQDIHLVLTAREIARWAREENIDLTILENTSFDSLLGRGSGAGVIFGNSGGVAEAVMRTASHLLGGKKVGKVKSLRTLADVKEAKLNIRGKTLHIAVINGANNARQYLNQLKLGKAKHYDFVEVMSCRGGCVGGGGQPKQHFMYGDKLLRARSKNLYTLDKASALHASYENAEVGRAYREFFDKPLSHIAEKYLHTTYTDRSKDLGEKDKISALKNKIKTITKDKNLGENA